MFGTNEIIGKKYFKDAPKDSIDDAILHAWNWENKCLTI